MISEVKDLLAKYAKPGVIDDETLARLAAYLTQESERLGHAQRNGDVTYSTINKNIHKQNLDEVNQAIEHARALLESRYGEPMRQQLEKRLWEMSVLKRIMEINKPQPRRGMPKASRMYFCVAIIVCWKVIRSTERMPGRNLTKDQEPFGEFYEFLGELLRAVHLLSIRADDLHRHILDVEAELNRLQ